MTTNKNPYSQHEHSGYVKWSDVKAVALFLIGVGIGQTRAELLADIKKYREENIKVRT